MLQFFRTKKKERILRDKLFSAPRLKFEITRLIRIATEICGDNPEMAEDIKQIINDLNSANEKANTLCKKYSPDIKVDGV